MKLEALYEGGITCVQKGQSARSQGNRHVTLVAYRTAVLFFSQALTVETNEHKKRLTKKQVAGLEEDINGLEENSPTSKETLPLAEFTLEQAVVLDELGLRESARELYMKSVTCYMQLSKTDPTVATYKKRAGDIIDRVEHLDGLRGAKASVVTQSVAVQSAASGSPRKGSTGKNVSKMSKNVSKMSQMSQSKVDDLPTAPSSPVRADTKYSAAEMEVLSRSSLINGNMFLPFIRAWDVEDLNVRSNSAKKFVDPLGMLAISDKQKSRFQKWKRAGSLFPSGKMISAVSPVFIKQEVVTDCSFVSSLCVASNYERRFRKQLITKIIFPQNAKGVPVINPCGKYLVKLWFNGIPRKVVVDDYLPVDKRNRLLCSYSSNDELWVSIVEKAYVKVNGGYDFPGSTSAIDLYALTGWVPEVHYLQKIHTQAQQDRTWKEMLNGYGRGDVLITVSTGEMVEEEADRLGLVPTHAYAVLNVVEVHGQRLLQLKNPWSSVRWKGNFSPDDTVNWTAALKKALHYDQVKAVQYDNGIFWIDYISLLNIFDGLFLNWNPELFKHRVVLHKHWKATGPANDAVMLCHNPQYKLTINVPTTSKQGVVWILLSRHITHKDQILSDAKDDCLTLHVYDRRRGDLVLYPDNPRVRGVYSNNPHLLCTLQLQPGDHVFTLVVSAYQKKRQVDYTLTVYATLHCGAPTLTEIVSKLEHTKDISHQWTNGKVVEGSQRGGDNTAGGSTRFSTYMNNPHWRLVVRETSKVRIRLMTYKEVACNLRVFKGAKRVTLINPELELANSGDYRQGFCYVQIDRLPQGVYLVVPSTYNPKQEAPIKLLCESSSAFKIERLPPEGHGFKRYVLRGEWSAATGTNAGCVNYGNYHHNPLVKLVVEAQAGVKLFTRLTYIPPHAETERKVKWPSLNVALFAGEALKGSGDMMITQSNGGLYSNPPAGVSLDVVTLQRGQYLLVPSTFDPFVGRFMLRVFSSTPLASIQLS